MTQASLPVIDSLPPLDGPAAAEVSARPTSTAFPACELGVATPDPLAALSPWVQARLGMASGLFRALWAKHPPTAEHGRRVSQCCSRWATNLQLAPSIRHEIEVAALLHDVGKIAIPDRILRKPEALSEDETKEMLRHRFSGLAILSACCLCQEILDIVEHAGAWYDGSRAGYTKRQGDLPLGARMIAITDAFDAMTSNQVYRGAWPRERAIGELFAHAGTQFDPDLVEHFAYLQQTQPWDRSTEDDATLLCLPVCDAVDSYWGPVQRPETSGLSQSAWAMANFQQQILASSLDAMIFLDCDLSVLYWSPGAELLTGVKADSMLHQHWSAEVIGLRDGKGRRLAAGECPLSSTRASGTPCRGRYWIRDRTGEPATVEVHTVPVTSPDGTPLGVGLVLHDLRTETSLEERVQSLHARATRDPLTDVANRTEFDRIHAEVVATHLARSAPCSLIMCDIDRFKQINDVHGHQAGDEALIQFAALLRRSCRDGDLVARYGGEEFALVCVDCDNPSATARAERIRTDLTRLALPSLGGRNIAASFGVTELQRGDTPESMLRRADRALLTAKETGRNRVVQLGVGLSPAEPQVTVRKWFPWGRRPASVDLLSRQLVSLVPRNLLAEKVRGFLADHGGEIVAADELTAVMKITSQQVSSIRRSSDRPMTLLIHLTFQEQRAPDDGIETEAKRFLKTLVHVAIRAERARDRRGNAVESATRLYASLKSYLMASAEDEVSQV